LLRHEAEFRRDLTARRSNSGIFIGNEEVEFAGAFDERRENRHGQKT
jgi:hypothetical protein